MRQVEVNRQWLEAWSRSHGGLRPTGLVGGWLRLIYPIAARVHAVPPLVFTIGGVLVGWLAVWPAVEGWPVLAAACVAGAAVCDGLDGAVAILSRRVSVFGALADRFADRLTEVGWALALWLAGAAGWACTAACVTGLLHEYVRARAGIAMPLTMSERPTRVLFAALGLLGEAVVAGSLRWVVPVSFAVAVIGFGQLLSLRRPGRGHRG
jgi:phosphatidylglycerophosphate synthase